MGLKEFLVDLGTNPAVQRRYAENTEGLLLPWQLTAEERAAFTSGDSAHIRTALGKPENDCMSQTGQRVPAGSRIIMMPSRQVVAVNEDSLLVCDRDFAPLLKAIKHVRVAGKGGTRAARKGKSRKMGKKAGRKR